jgi:carboxypeptidase D
MHISSLLALGGLATSVAGRTMQSVGKKELPKPRIERPNRSRNVQNVKRQSSSIITTEASKKFIVNGTAGASE